MSEYKGETSKVVITQEHIEKMFGTEERGEILGEASELEIVNPDVMTDEKQKEAEFEKLKFMILRDGIATLSPRQLFYSGRVKLEIHEIRDYIEKHIKSMSPEDTMVVGLKGMDFFDDILQRAKDGFDMCEDQKEMNQTMMVAMAALEKKADWMERFGFKPKVVEPLGNDSQSQMSLMRDIYKKKMLEKKK